MEWVSSPSARPKIGQPNEKQSIALLDLCTSAAPHSSTDTEPDLIPDQPQRCTLAARILYMIWRSG